LIETQKKLIYFKEIFFLGGKISKKDTTRFNEWCHYELYRGLKAVSVPEPVTELFEHLAYHRVKVES